MRRWEPLFVCAGLLVLAAWGQGIETRTAPFSSVSRVPTARFEVEDLAVTVSAPRAWSSLLPNDMDFGRLEHREIHGARIVFRRILLPEPPADEASAVVIYERHVKEQAPSNFIKDMRPPPSLSIGRFGECFTLSTGERDPPRMMRVLFVEGKHLYDVRLEVPDRLIGPLRKEYFDILGSICLEPIKPPSSGNEGTVGVSTNSSPR